MAERKIKICFYSPYIPTSTGGGEKHVLAIAKALSAKAEIYIALPDIPAHHDTHFISSIKKKYELFLNTNLDFINWIISPLGTSGTFIKKLFWTRSFDYIFYVTDGSIFFSLARHNILHLQIPFSTNYYSGFFSRLKLKNWQIINTNSFFTKKIIERSWNIKVNSVIHPAINPKEFSPNTTKKQIILSVGRFFKQLHSKRQDIAIDLFKTLCDQDKKIKKDWVLLLVGPVEDISYVQELKRSAKGYPIEFQHDVSREQLVKYYNQAKIYWHTAGYGIDQSQHPEKVEHFGITTVEAMAAACVPLVLGKGGQIEVIGKELVPLIWRTKEECLAKTTQLMYDTQTYTRFQVSITKRADFFSYDRFTKQVYQLFGLE